LTEQPGEWIWTAALSPCLIYVIGTWSVRRDSLPNRVNWSWILIRIETRSIGLPDI
jgi:hypothetical protein